MWLVTAHSPPTIKIGAAAWLCDIPPDKPGQKRVGGGGRRKEEEEEAATRKTTQGVDSGLSVAHSPRIHTHADSEEEEMDFKALKFGMRWRGEHFKTGANTSDKKKSPVVGGGLNSLEFGMR